MHTFVSWISKSSSSENKTSFVAINGIPFLDDKGSRLAKYSFSSSLLVLCTSKTKSSSKAFRNWSIRFSASSVLFLLSRLKIWLSLPPDITTMSSFNSVKLAKSMIGV